MLTLFNIFMDAKNKKCQCLFGMLGDLHLYHLLYSKDTVWLSERGSQLQNILSAMNEVHAKFELGINLGKKSL